MWRLFKPLFRSSYGRRVQEGKVSDLALHLRRLTQAPSAGFLIVAVGGLDDGFLQFSAGNGLIQMDHPLITEAQAAREQPFRAACETIRRPAYESRGSDGSRFLDCDLSSDPEAAAADVRRVLELVFRIEATTELTFIGEGLPAVPGSRDPGGGAPESR